MEPFVYRNGALFVENRALADIARLHGTPTYVYSRAAIETAWKAYDVAFGAVPHLVCFAVKSNSNLAVLGVLARLGAGFDIVSVGELERVLAAGGAPEKIVFSGVGKRRDEIARALQVGIYCFNVESLGELERINSVAAQLGMRARVSLRVNPDVDAKTHPYISTGLKENKFGIDINAAVAAYQRAQELPHIEIAGVDCHIGSQLTESRPFVDALSRVLQLIDQLYEHNIVVRHLDIGGGLGIRYRQETPPDPAAHVMALLQQLGSRNLKVLIEPGRSIVGNAGVLLTRVEYLKPMATKNFAIVDAAMNDLLRPALYGAWQDIVPVIQRDGPALTYDVVGPVCETGDFLGKDRSLVLEEGDMLAVRSAGAYGFVMSSNYNTRPRAAEVMVDGAEIHLARERETMTALWAGETVLST